MGSIVVADLVSDEGSSSRLATVIRALHLIENLLPYRWWFIQRRLRRVLIVEGGGQLYSFDLNACVLDVKFVTKTREARIAAMVVHEATHARLSWWGVGYDRASRQRIEEFCARVEADALTAFGLPRMASDVALRVASPWWTDEQLLLRRASQREAHRISRPLARAWIRIRNAIAIHPKRK